MEIKTPIFKRIPPGDRWGELDNGLEKVYISITEALEYYFQKTNIRQYYIDASLGYIYKVEEVEPPIPPLQLYSLYGEEY
jgi:hypothetical protein